MRAPWDLGLLEREALLSTGFRTKALADQPQIHTGSWAPWSELKDVLKSLHGSPIAVDIPPFSNHFFFFLIIITPGESESSF